MTSAGDGYITKGMTIMTNAAPDEVKYGEMVKVTGHWGWLLVIAVLEIIAGIFAVAFPGITVLALSIIFGVDLLIIGVVSVATVFRIPSGASGRGWAAVLGVLAIVGGLICLLRPATGVFAILIGLSIWFFAAGLNDLARAVAGPQRWFPGIVGVLSLVAGVIVLSNPWTGIGTVALIVGFGFILRGAMDATAAFAIRRGGTSISA